MAMKSETNFNCSHSAKSIVTNNMVDKANEINNKIHPFIIHEDKIKLWASKRRLEIFQLLLASNVETKVILEECKPVAR